MTDETKDELVEKLTTIHALTINKVLGQLQSEEPLTASWLREARALLADNQITAESIGKERGNSYSNAMYQDLPFPAGSGTSF